MASMIEDSYLDGTSSELTFPSRHEVLEEEVVSHSENVPDLVQTKGRKQATCPVDGCGKTYTTLHHLRVHMRSHSGERPYKCSHCEQRFASLYSHKVHQRKHTGETPYVCSYCSKGFRASSDLTRHSRIHTGDRPFRCGFEGCPKTFTTAHIKQLHMRTHTGERPYECTYVGCEKKFVNATNLRNHIRIHTGDKPYKCQVANCDKSFTEYSSLYKHLVVHTSEKPYKCQNCGKMYRQSSSLRQHVKTHSKSVLNIKVVKSVTSASDQPDALQVALTSSDEINDVFETIPVSNVDISASSEEHHPPEVNQEIHLDNIISVNRLLSDASIDHH